MLSPLSPTARDVQKLDDVDLRQLLVALCEAELGAAGRDLSGLTAGGDQNAADGGLDLRIDGAGPGLPYLPRFPIGIQVKAESMGPAKILKEMQPHGVPRSVLSELARQGGAYIIASGRDNCSSSRLQDRTTAMAKAAGADPDGHELTLDFYDADRLARWAAGHPGVVLWLAGKIGAPTSGWRAYGAWSAPAISLDAPFLFDDATRVRQDAVADACTTTQALENARALLSRPGAAVRFVGLSGMGKTRFAQALFDRRLVAPGNTPLDSTLAVYGDAGASPEVPPERAAEHLAHRGSRAVLIVDNCPSDLHRRLVDMLRRIDGKVSLITIDFDVADDQLPDTVTFRLELASRGLIEDLLIDRCPTLSRADRDRIVTFAGGNTRIALALAANSGRRGLAHLRDEQLMDRLFLNQRRAADETLRRVARAAALVNAFDTQPSGTESETLILAKLANVDAYTVHEKVSDLVERGLAQQRGSQRAILPQALAVRLADEAFHRIAPDLIWTAFMEEAPERLRNSFFRRLELLHDTPGAIEIVDKLLRPGSAYAVKALSVSEDWTVFRHLAPLAEDRALDLVSAAVRDADPHDASFRWRARDQAGKLLLAFAYSSERFEASCSALLHVILRLYADRRDNTLEGAFASLFQASSSGTEAPPAARFRFLERLLNSSDADERRIGVAALSSALMVKMPSHPLAPRFGARPQSQGWKPEDDEGWIAWFSQALGIALRHAGDPISGPDYRPHLARSLGDMLRIDILRPIAAATIRQSTSAGYWRDGWFALCRLLAGYQRGPVTPSSELIELEQELRPRTFPDRYETWVLGDPGSWRDPAQKEGGNWDRFFQRTHALGAELGRHPTAWKDFLSQATVDPFAKGYALGEGVASTLPDLEDGWRSLEGIIAELGPLNANPRALTGYIDGAAQRNPDLVDRWLEEASEVEALRPFTVDLHMAAKRIDAVGAARMLDVLTAGAAHPETFSGLQYARRSHTIPNELLAKIAAELPRWPGGLKVAFSVLHMRFHGANEAPLDDTLIAAGRSLLADLAKSASPIERGDEVASVARVCLPGPQGSKIARSLARHLVSMDISTASLSDEDSLVALIFRHHPKIALDVFLGGPPGSRMEWVIGGHDDDDEPDHRPLGVVPDSVLKTWVLASPDRRTAKLATHIAYFVTENEQMTWTPMAIWLMERPGQEGAVLDIFENRFHLGGFSGSISRKWERRRLLVEPLQTHANPAIAEWAVKLRTKLDTWITEEQSHERLASERFE
jgi:hypothetical protein